MVDTRAALPDASGVGGLLDEVPVKWRSLFELLAATGLGISEAVGLRWSDLVLDGPSPHVHGRRAIVKGAVVAPKSHGARLLPLTIEMAALLRAQRPDGATGSRLLARALRASGESSAVPPKQA